MGTSLRVERTHVGGAGQRKAGNDAVDHLQHRGEQLRVSGEQDAQWDRKRQHPLAHRHLRDHVIDQVRGALRRAPHEGQNPRRLHEKATSFSWPQSPQRSRRKPWARMPHSRKASTRL